jgi:hypothetical protein
VDLRQDLEHFAALEQPECVRVPQQRNKQAPLVVGQTRVLD